ncbi:MAG: carbohydrate kinase family protein [candidate division WS1 bacterium]|nr:carbohydrate kinase family protein [candidate division WS1 bacterium]
MRCMTVGEINVDVVLSGMSALPELGQEVLCERVETVMGSASCIFACRMAGLGEGSAICGLVGEDQHARVCLESLTAAGVDTSRVVRDPAVSTGATYIMSLPEDRAMVTHLGAIAQLTLSHVPEGLFNGVDHLHVTSPFLQLGLRPDLPDLMRRARAAGATVSFDAQWDPEEKWADTPELAALADVLLPNEVEARRMTGESDLDRALERLLEWGAGCVVIKAGDQGAMAGRGAERACHPAFPITPVDTTGAGDTFDAAFVKAFLADRLNLEDSLAFACAAGGLSCLQIGGIGEPLSSERVRAYIQEAQR